MGSCPTESAVCNDHVPCSSDSGSNACVMFEPGDGTSVRLTPPPCCRVCASPAVGCRSARCSRYVRRPLPAGPPGSQPAAEASPTCPSPGLARGPVTEATAPLPPPQPANCFLDPDPDPMPPPPVLSRSQTLARTFWRMRSGPGLTGLGLGTHGEVTAGVGTVRRMH